MVQPASPNPSPCPRTGASPPAETALTGPPATGAVEQVPAPHPRTPPVPPAQRSWTRLLKETWNNAAKDNLTLYAAALSYYTVFSLAPLLIIAAGVAGLVYGERATEGQLHEQLEGFLGEQGARGVEEVIARSHRPASGWLATLLGFGLLVYLSSTVMAELKSALDKIWDVVPQHGGGIIGVIIGRIWSAILVVFISLLLLLSVAMTTALHQFSGFAEEYARLPPVLLGIAGEATSFVLVALFFALIYKFLPDARIAWRDVWIGALVTALLFTAGKVFIGWYLSHAAISTTYGAAGSLVILLLWMYYSTQILLLGAEFTQAYACMYGSCIERFPVSAFYEQWITRGAD